MEASGKNTLKNVFQKIFRKNGSVERNLKNCSEANLENCSEAKLKTISEKTAPWKPVNYFCNLNIKRSVESDFHVKPEIRVLGIDDSALIDKKIMIVGTIFRGGGWMDGVLRSEITRDGLDATEVISRMARESKHYGQLRVIMLDGVTYGGFNVVDIVKLHEETGLPVIVVMRSYPDFEKIKAALKHFPDGEERWNIIEKAGKIEKVVTQDRENPVYIQKKGIGIKSAEKIVRLTAIRSNIPEPLRVAHLIATGIVLGESRGKA